LVDVFINHIYFYDAPMRICYNAQDAGHMNIPIGESEKVRLWGELVERNEPNTNRIVILPYGFAIRVRL